MNPDDIGKAFVEHYYTLVRDDKERLCELYTNESVMKMEADTFVGRDAIRNKYLALTYKKIAHEVSSVDVQPIQEIGALLVVVTGRLKTDEDNPHGFTQTFLLKQSNDSIVIANEIFRMMLHNL